MKKHKIGVSKPFAKRTRFGEMKMKTIWSDILWTILITFKANGLIIEHLFIIHMEVTFISCFSIIFMHKTLSEF